MADFAPPLRILVAAENSLARAGLAALLFERPGLEIVGQCGVDDGLEGAIDLHRPDAVVCDLGYDPLRAADRLTEVAGHGPALLALVADARAAAEAAPVLVGLGVRGVLLQDSPPDVLAAALMAAGQGLSVFGADIAPALLASARLASAHEAAIEAFTPREREVLALVAEGLPNKLIARQLHISEHTVKFHVNALLTKLGAASRTEAVVRATRLGLIAL